MQKTKGNYKQNNTFIYPHTKYINDDNCYEKMDARDGDMAIQGGVIVEQEEILRPQLIIDSYQNRFLPQEPDERVFSIDKIKDGSIIKLFDKTPKPVNPTDVVCPHFYELKWANGCNFNCAWCYLNGTYRFLSGGKKPRLKNVDVVLNHLDCFFNSVDGRFLLNSGELSDSLLFENDGAPLTQR